MKPDLETFSDLVSITKEWEQAGSPPDKLLQQILPVFTASLPEVQALRLYWLEGDALAPVAATDRSISEPIELDASHKAVLEASSPLRRDDQAGWVVVLRRGEQPVGLLEVAVDPDGKPSPDGEAWLGFAAAQLSNALDSRATRDLIRRQSTISYELTNCASFHEVAAVLARHLLSSGQFISINVSDYDERGNLTGFRTIATANRRDAFETEFSVKITFDELGPLAREAIENGQPVLIEDIQDDPTLSEKIKSWNAGTPLVSTLMAPMHLRDRVFGLLNLNSTRGTLRMAAAEIELFQTLADQISTLVQLYNLTEESSQSRDVSERQKRVFNELVAGQEYDEMTRIIARHMLLRKGGVMAIIELAYNDRGQIARWNVLATANGEGDDAFKDRLGLAWDDVSAEVQNTVYDLEPFIIEDRERLSPEAIGPAFYQWLEDNDLNTYIGIPIEMEGRPLGMLIVMSRYKGAFSRDEINAFQNIAGQMGALVHVRRLIQEAEEARSIVVNLVLANRMITTALNPGYMAQAVMYTLGRKMTAAGITQFDRALTEGEAPQSHALVAFGTAHEFAEIDSEEVIGLPNRDEIAKMNSGLAAVLDEARINELLPTDLRNNLSAWLGDVDVTWAALFGLRSGEELLGTLVLVSDSMCELSDAEVNAYTTLADQIGIVTRGRELLEESQQAQAVASQLVQTNRAISTADDYGTISQTILQAMPKSITMVAILLFDEAITTHDVPEIISTEAVATREQILYPDVIDTLDPKHPRLQPGLQRMLAGEASILEDSRQRDVMLMPESIRYLNSMGAYSFVTVGLRSGSRLLGLLVCGAPENVRISEVQLNNILATADQAAATIENRNLLDQTADALGFVHAQYETTNALYKAETPVEMLTAIYEFVSDFCDRLHLALVDEDAAEGETVLRVVAEIEQGRVVDRSRTDVLESYVGAQRLTDLNEVVDFDVEHADDLDEDDRARLQASGVGAVWTLPLVTASHRLLGLVHFTNSAAVDMPFNWMRALRTLVEQLTIVLENRRLLRTTEVSLQETRTLYDVNRELLACQSELDVLRVLRRHLTQDAKGITLASMQWDEATGDVTSFRIEAMIDAEGERESGEELLSNVFGPEDMELFKMEWELQGHDVDFIEDIDAIIEDRPVSKFAKEGGDRSNVIIPIWDEDHLSQQINITYAEPRRFDERTRRLYTAIRDQIAVVLQNQRLLRDMQSVAANLGNQVRVLETINHLATTLTAVQDEQIIMDTTCEAMFNALNVDHVAFTLVDTDGQLASIVSEYPGHGSVGMQIEVHGGLREQLEERRTPITIDDIAGHPDLGEMTRALLQESGAQSVLLLPLYDARSGYMGAILLTLRSSEHSFSPAMSDTARTMASQVVVSLQNIRLLRNTRNQARQMERVAAFAQAIQTTLDMNALLNIALTNVTQIIPAQHMSVMFFEGERGQLETVAWQDDDQTQVSLEDGQPIELEGTTAGHVWNTRSALRLDDLSKEENLRHTHRDDIRSVMSLPLFSRGVALGVVEVGSRQPSAYSPIDGTIFQQLVSQFSVAIENTEAYMQSQRLAKSKALVNDISSSLQQEMEIDRILDLTMKELGRALGARRARIRLDPDAISEEGVME